MNNIRKIIRQINTGLPNNEEKTSKVITFLTPNESISQQTVVANLGLMYAQASEKTVIINTDFTKENFAKTFNLPIKLGLSDYLDRGDIQVKSIIQDVKENENLSLITSGMLDPDKTDLILGDPKMAVLVKFLEREYDKVLINTSGSTVISNELLSILKKSDGVVFVSDLRSTKKRVVLSMMHDLWSTSVNVLGYISAEK